MFVGAILWRAKASWAASQSSCDTSGSTGAQMRLTGPLRAFPEHLLAAVDGLDEHVADAPSRPALPGAIAADASPVVGVARRDPEGVQLVGDLPAAAVIERDPLVHQPDDIDRGQVGLDDLVVGHEPGLALLALDAVAVRPDAADVAAFAGGPVHAVGRATEELAADVARHDRLEAVAGEVMLTLGDTAKVDTEVFEPATDDE